MSYISTLQTIAQHNYLSKPTIERLEADLNRAQLLTSLLNTWQHIFELPLSLQQADTLSAIAERLELLTVTEMMEGGVIDELNEKITQLGSLS